MDRATLSLMAPHLHHLTGVRKYAVRIVQRYSLRTSIEAHTDLAPAIRGADIVFLLFDAGGFSAFDQDFTITKASGIDLCIGDTMGPTGMMKAVRNVSVLKEVAAEIRKSAPDCLVISYVNPMAVMTMAARQLGIRRFVGICGGVEATRHTIATCLGESVDSITTRFAGINHMAWALEIQKDNEDLYPRLRQRMATPKWTAAEPTRAEVLQHFGYFVTETSGHLSDFFPWFRRDQTVLKRYGSGTGYTGASGAYHRFAGYVHRRLQDVDPFAYEDGELDARSEEYGSFIANAWITGEDYEFYGNLSNHNGLIANLPTDAAVEVPTHIKGNAIEGQHMDRLPTQLAALCTTNILVQQMCVEAVLRQAPQLLLSAISMDPLTAATIDLTDTRRLTEELIAANHSWLPRVEHGFRFRDVSIDSSAPPSRANTSGQDVLEPVKRFDRSKRKIDVEARANTPNHD